MFCDIQGQISEVTNCKGTEDEDPQTATVDDILDDIANYKAPSDSEDEDNENVISLEKLKKDIMGPKSEPDSDQSNHCYCYVLLHKLFCFVSVGSYICNTKTPHTWNTNAGCFHADIDTDAFESQIFMLQWNRYC